jgi:hypothetical protein
MEESASHVKRSQWRTRKAHCRERQTIAEKYDNTTMKQCDNVTSPPFHESNKSRKVFSKKLFHATGKIKFPD